MTADVLVEWSGGGRCRPWARRQQQPRCCRRRPSADGIARQSAPSPSCLRVSRKRWSDGPVDRRAAAAAARTYGRRVGERRAHGGALHLGFAGQRWREVKRGSWGVANYASSPSAARDRKPTVPAGRPEVPSDCSSVITTVPQTAAICAARRSLAAAACPDCNPVRSALPSPRLQPRAVTRLPGARRLATITSFLCLLQGQDV
jgi:hypothetical protein